MFGFARRPNSAEKCDSSSSADNCTPQIGHEPVDDGAPPMCIGFFGPIPEKLRWLHVSIIASRLFYGAQHNYFFINFSLRRHAKSLFGRKKSCAIN